MKFNRNYESGTKEVRCGGTKLSVRECGVDCGSCAYVSSKTNLYGIVIVSCIRFALYRTPGIRFLMLCTGTWFSTGRLER